jgi:hypothetical protein
MAANDIRGFLAAGLILGLAGGSEAAEATAPDPAKLEFFEKKVRPILANHCTACHDATTKPAGGLRVDDLNGLLVGGNSGAAIVPGKPGESLLLKRVNQDGSGRCRWTHGSPARTIRSPAVFTSTASDPTSGRGSSTASAPRTRICRGTSPSTRRRTSAGP